MAFLTGWLPGEKTPEPIEFPGLKSYRNAQVGTMILPADSFMVNTYNRTHGVLTSMEKAEAFRDGGKNWKQTIGPDTDYSDRRLAIPIRLRSASVEDIAMMMDDME